MKRFYVIDRGWSRPVWAALVLDIIPSLATKPAGWRAGMHDTTPDIVEGDWTIFGGSWNLATPEDYHAVGIYPPLETELPALFCVNKFNMSELLINATVDSAREFIRERII